MDPLQVDQAKTAFNARVKQALREDLRAKSWEEKVASIERMNVAGKIAREAMRKVIGEKELASGAKARIAEGEVRRD